MQLASESSGLSSPLPVVVVILVIAEASPAAVQVVVEVVIVQVVVWCRPCGWRWLISKLLTNDSHTYVTNNLLIREKKIKLN